MGKTKKIDSKEMEKRALLHMAQEHYKEADRYAERLKKVCGKDSEDWIWDAVCNEHSFETFTENIK